MKKNKSKLNRFSVVGALVVVVLTTTGFASGFFEITKQLEIFNTLFKELSLNYVDETTPATLMDKAINGMLEGLDPYTIFYNEQDVGEARINSGGALALIGAELRRYNDRWLIAKVDQDGAADKAGLRPGDELAQINGLDIDPNLDQIDPLLNGSPGSLLTLSYLRLGARGEALLTREKTVMSSVAFSGLATPKIGYIAVTEFSAKTSADTKKALYVLKEQGAESLILDLRGNPGGLLSEAVNMVGLFVPKGTLVTYTQSVVAEYNVSFTTTTNPVDLEIPIVVLINGRSASASEIVSGALQDLDRGVVVGGRSFGKGLVQRPKKLSYGTQFKVTISRYYTPSGRCIQALDYWNRDENGDPVKTLPKNYNAFQTKGGRTVYDGGGVLPDVVLPSSDFSPITTALLKTPVVLDFGADFYARNDISSWENFAFSNSHYQGFVGFVAAHQASIETQTEALLGGVLKMAQTEALWDKISPEMVVLEQQIQKAKEALLQDKKEEIQALVVDDLLLRYFYTDGLYRYKLKNNPEVLEAVDLLSHPKKYAKILQP